MKHAQNLHLFLHCHLILRVYQSHISCDSATLVEIQYVIIGEEGPDHAKRFVVEVRIGEKKAGTGKGSTKKAAEQEAAYRAIIALKGNH